MQAVCTSLLLVLSTICVIPEHCTTIDFYVSIAHMNLQRKITSDPHPPTFALTIPMLAHVPLTTHATGMRKRNECAFMLGEAPHTSDQQSSRIMATYRYQSLLFSHIYNLQTF